MTDPVYAAREDIITVEDRELGPIRMPGVFPTMSRTPGRIRHSGPRLGQHSGEIIQDLVARQRISTETAAQALGPPAAKKR